MTKPDHAAAEAVAKWNAESQIAGNPVLWWVNGDRAKPAQTAVAIGLAWVADQTRPMVRLSSDYYRGVHLDHVERHPLTDKIRSMPKPADATLEFPPPDCGFCETVPCEYDDGFACPQCGARWSADYGHLGGATRLCVEAECVEEATVRGKDEQPRCVLHQTLILAGEEEGFAPYNCRNCQTRVIGIGPDRPPYADLLCGGCNHASTARAELERLIERTVASRTAA
jgi:hypothetical protein